MPPFRSQALKGKSKFNDEAKGIPQEIKYRGRSYDVMAEHRTLTTQGINNHHSNPKYSIKLRAAPTTNSDAPTSTFSSKLFIKNGLYGSEY